MDLFKPEMLDQIKIEKGEVADIVEPVGCVGRPEVGVFRYDQVVLLGQHVHEGQPARHACCAMQEKQRLALALSHHADPATGDGFE